MRKTFIGPHAYCTAAVFGLLVSFPLTAWSAVSTYTNRSLWEAAVGPRSFEENFEGFTSDIDFSLAPTSAPNGFTLSHTGPNSFRNLIDVPPLEFGDGNGTNGVSTFVDRDGGDVVSIIPDFGLISFCLETSTAASGEGATITTVGPGGASLTTVALANSIDAFLGFQATGGDRIIRVDLMGLGDGSDAGEGFYMDNIAGVFVPEPTTLALLIVASLHLGCRRYTTRHISANVT